MKNLLEQIMKTIFSISNENEFRYLIQILGIRIHFPKKCYKEKLKSNPYYVYFKEKRDITTLPAATGQTREIQLANFELLKELDYVCRKENINYWLDGGTLLGAVRHKGFIPWDDDIDVAMLREDYNKFLQVFNKATRNPDFFVDYYRGEKNTYFLKVQSHNCPHLFVDIFPFDEYNRNISLKEQIKLSDKIKEQRYEEINIHLDYSDEELHTAIKKFRQKITDTAGENNEFNTFYVWGADFHHIWKNWFTAYDVIFPLKTIKFEEYEFSCMNNPDSYLKRLYGNYMSYPPKIGFGHNSFLDLEEEEKESIRQLIGHKAEEA